MEMDEDLSDHRPLNMNRKISGYQLSFAKDFSLPPKVALPDKATFCAFL